MSRERKTRRAARRGTEELPKGIQKTKLVLNRIRRVLPHPLWGIAVATLIAFSGRGELLLRSIGMLLVAVWLSLDLWAWLFDRHPRWRWTLAFGATVTSLTLIVVMVIMWLWMEGKLQDQRDDVFEQLKAEFNTPPTGGANAVMRSAATVVNDGHFDIGMHEIVCIANRLQWDDGSSIQDMTLGMFTSTSPIKGSGDGQTDICMGTFNFSNTLPSGKLRKFECGDVTVEVNYSLVTQPEIKQRKLFRFVSNQDTSFGWKPQPQGDSNYFCPEPKGNWRVQGGRH